MTITVKNPSISVSSVVITGASEGIGRAMAIEFARGGAKLGLIARRRELLEVLAAELRSLGAADVRIATLDVTDSSAQRTALERFERELGGITHFIANAGVSGRSRPERDTADEIRKCFEVNVLAAVDGIEWVKERMVARGSGTIAGVSSVAAIRGLPDSGGYSSSKAALSKYLESLRVDLASYGIRVVTIAPGYIDTTFTRKNRGRMPFLMPVEEAARIFVRGVLDGRRTVVAPWQYAWIIRALRFMPDAIYDRMIRRFVKRIREPASKFHP
jgi:short-subunit dehydrogenase